MSAPQVLQALIDKLDTFEIVRDQIAAIILAETANQQQKALAAGKDKRLWALRVFTERNGTCWHHFTSGGDVDDDQLVIDQTPIVNVWHAEHGFDRKKSPPSGDQVSDGTFHIDIYGCGIATDTSEGHDPGELLAAREVERAYRLIRNTLASPINENLQLLGTVGDRWIKSFKTQPINTAESAKPQLENVAIGRIELEVSFLEYAPEYQGVTIENIAGTVLRKETGEIYFKTTT